MLGEGRGSPFTDPAEDSYELGEIIGTDEAELLEEFMISRQVGEHFDHRFGHLLAGGDQIFDQADLCQNLQHVGVVRERFEIEDRADRRTKQQVLRHRRVEIEPLGIVSLDEVGNSVLGKPASERLPGLQQLHGGFGINLRIQSPTQPQRIDRLVEIETDEHLGDAPRQRVHILNPAIRTSTRSGWRLVRVEDMNALSRRITEVLVRLDLDEAIYSLGLRWRLDPEVDPEAAIQLLEARKALARRLAEDGITNLVETYDPERFNLNASVAENLLFGTPIGPVFDFEALADNAYVLQVLTQVGLIEDLVAAGKQVAETMIEMFADLPADHEFFEQFSFISANDLPEFVAILGRIGEGGTAALAKQDRAKLLSLPFKLVPARHRLDVVDDPMQHRLLEARKVFRANLPQKARQQIEFFDPERYNAAASVQDNILFGKIAYGEADAPTRIPRCSAK